MMRRKRRDCEQEVKKQKRCFYKLKIPSEQSFSFPLIHVWICEHVWVKPSKKEEVSVFGRRWACLDEWKQPPNGWWSFSCSLFIRYSAGWKRRMVFMESELRKTFSFIYFKMFHLQRQDFTWVQLFFFFVGGSGGNWEPLWNICGRNPAAPTKHWFGLVQVILAIKLRKKNR